MLRKNNLKNFFLGFVFLLLNVFSFAEIPHSYVTENPKKEIQKVETFKEKEKAELNLTATKIKVKEIEGKLIDGKLVFDISDKKDIQEGNILVTQGIPYKPNNARVRSANTTQILEATKEANKLEVTGKNLQNVYINIFDKNNKLINLYKTKNNINLNIYNSYLETEIDFNLLYDSFNIFQGKYLTHRSNHKSFSIDALGNLPGLELGYYNQSLTINGINIPEVNNKNNSIQFFTKKLEINKDLILEIKIAEGYGNVPTLEYRFLKYPQNKEFYLEFDLNYDDDDISLVGYRGRHIYRTNFIPKQIKKEEFYSLIRGEIERGGISKNFFDRVPNNFGGTKAWFDSIHPNYGKESPDMVKMPPQIYLENDIKKFTINNIPISEVKGINPHFSKIVTISNDLIIEIRNGNFNSTVGDYVLEWRFIKHPLDKDFIIEFNVESYIKENNTLRNHKFTFEAFKYKVDNEWQSKVEWEIDDNYNATWIERDKIHADYNVSEEEDPWGMYYKGLKVINANGTHAGWQEAGFTLLPLEGNLYSLAINGKEIPNVATGDFSGTLRLNSDLLIEYRVRKDGVPAIFTYKFLEFPKNDFEMIFNLTGNYNQEEYEHIYKNYYKYKKPQKLIGNSTLTFKEYYPVNEFVQFTANPSIQNAQPLALDNSVRDVTLETTGKGLVTMQQGDKLTVDGHQVVIGAGGNIGPQKLTIGNVKYTYEVKNGKFRIALNEWGVLEPNRTIPIKIVRNENDKDKSLAEHNLTIKAPRRVEGTSNVKLNQDYSIRNTIRFNGISLQGAGALGLENPIPLGVSLTSASGQGIPFMKEGDILQINDDLTRAVKAFTIGPNRTLGKQQVKLNNGELTVFVEGGKLRVGVNNWLVNNTINSNVRLVRGTNEIMNHTLEFKTPEAPFNIKKNGILDFGNVTAGTKRTAETDIVLEMIKDVSDVKFNLKDPQPMLENLGTGDNLKVNRIEYLVSKQSKRDYKVKLKGNLAIPEGTKSGLYTGSTMLELKIK